ncbi:MAG: histidine--tRNA ligase [Faecalibacterium sp.]|nr:histidine--tRNA ligase [Ruminococcus sp.]MCM1391856.1 histidine--tRNA ligase [Ruminococcus sp.]MCM1486504.1 histidine--tRNA ligase [Faecalibacterium sp.]
MALVTKSIKGTQDVLPAESYKNQFLEQTCLEIAGNFGFKEIRTPVFEHTELFQRSVGDTTDVVQKEMYTFNDKGGRSITLRPEGTAGAVRSYLEHGLYNEPMPQKMCYITSCYRYEKPQAGRLREFHQFGIECLGAGSPAADAEIISVANEIFKFLGVRGLKLEINSIGCPKCRAEYHKALHDYFDERKDELCGTCRDRLDRNPMRILDCKSPICSEIASGAPKVIDYLCDDCREHFDKVQHFLKAMDIAFEVNPSIVRGLDYYTRTVFEFVSTDIGAQGTVCGGGRYDGLVEEIGGGHTPALGFGMGLERLMLVMEQQGLPFPEPDRCELYIASMGENALAEVARIASSLRTDGIHTEIDIVGRSVKAQMKYANKLKAKFTMVLGDSELESKKVKLKNMETGEETEMELDTFEGDFMRLSISESLKSFEDMKLDETLDINAILGGSLS